MNETVLEGRVLSVLSEEIHVQNEQIVYPCTLRGILKKEKTNKKNLLIVGDLVLFDPDQKVIIKV